MIIIASKEEKRKKAIIHPQHGSLAANASLQYKYRYIYPPIFYHRLFTLKLGGWVGDGRAGWQVKAGLHLDKGCVQGQPKDHRSCFIIHDCRKCVKVSQLAWPARRWTVGGSRVLGQNPHRHMLDMQTLTQKKDPGRDWNLFAVKVQQLALHCCCAPNDRNVMMRTHGMNFVSKAGISIQKIKSPITWKNMFIDKWILKSATWVGF